MQVGETRDVVDRPRARRPHAWFRATSTVTVLAMTMSLFMSVGDLATAAQPPASAATKAQPPATAPTRRPATVTVALRGESAPSVLVSRQRAKQRLHELFAAQQSA